MLESANAVIATRVGFFFQAGRGFEVGSSDSPFGIVTLCVHCFKEGPILVRETKLTCWLSLWNDM